MTPADFYRIVRRVWRRAPVRHIERDDAVQAAVLRCWQYRDRFDSARGKAGTFFSIVAWTEFQRQADRRHNRTLITQPMGCELCPGPGPDEAADLSCKLDWLRRAMTSDDAEVLIPLHAGETQRELARRLGLTRDQVQRRKNAALSRLTIAARRDTLTLQP